MDCVDGTGWRVGSSGGCGSGKMVWLVSRCGDCRRAFAWWYLGVEELAKMGNQGLEKYAIKRKRTGLRH